MGLFSRKQKQPAATIPEPYLRGLRDFGEHLVGRRAAFNTGLVADLDITEFAEREPDAYVDLLATGIFNGPAHISGHAGACCLGAAEGVTTVLELDVSSPSWYRIVDTAIEYLRTHGVPYAKVKPYMRARWEQAHSPDEW